MKFSLQLSLADDPLRSIESVRELEANGVDLVWIPEAYGFEAFSIVAHLLASTTRINVGTGIVNVFSRTPALLAMAGATAQHLSGGRFALGLGASGPQVIEGLHGVPYDKPVQRILDTIAICRSAWNGDKIEHCSAATTVPYAGEGGEGLGKALRLMVRPPSPVPIWWASLKPRAVEHTAAVADGWLPVFFLPDRAEQVWGEHLSAGLTRRDSAMPALQICAGGAVAVDDSLIGDNKARVLDELRPFYALYIGGMGAVGKNFYNDIVCAYGYEDQARRIQEAFLAGRKDEAASLVPFELLDLTNLVGPPSWVQERVAAYEQAGVTHLQVTPSLHDPATTMQRLRALVD
jgi:F420-dependent oxidoreductase-like protein